MGLKNFLNSSEQKTLKIIQPLEDSFGCRFHAKVKLGDILELRGSGLDPECFNYASRAHFDFIAVQDNQVCFAIELDGPGHYFNDTTAERDKKKNYICKHFDFELLRIDLGYLNEVEDSHVLPILLENHLIRTLSKNRWKQNTNSPIINWKKKKKSPEYLLAQNARVHETLRSYSVETHRTFERREDEFVYVAKVLQVDDEQYCVGQSSAHSSKIFGLHKRRLAKCLAEIDLSRNIIQYETGLQPGKAPNEIEQLHSIYTAPGKLPELRKFVLESFSNYYF